jgi:hypothetical protein
MAYERGLQTPAEYLPTFNAFPALTIAPDEFTAYWLNTTFKT